MNFFETTSKFVEIGFLFWMFMQYLLLWIHPSATDGEKIFFMALLMGFEFIMLAAGVGFMIPASEGSWKLFTLFFVFFGLFAFCFTIIAGNSKIIWIYAGLALSRMFTMFTADKAAIEAMMGSAALSMMLFFFLMMLIVFSNQHIPAFKLTEGFLESINYEKVRRIGGMFTEKPHIAICLGALYYGLLFMGKFIKMIFKIVNSA
jgi:hypothetical protein